MSIKSSDLTCYPLCGPHPVFLNYTETMRAGCHHGIGSSAKFTRDDRRELESSAASDTRAELVLRAAGDPKVRAVLVKVGLLP